MKDYLKKQGERLLRRLHPFLDMTAWVLLLIGFIPLYLIDRAMLLTLLQWSAFGLALAANAVVLSRLFLPQVDLSEWVKEAKQGSVAAALVVASVALLISAVFIGLVIWSKA